MMTKVLLTLLLSMNAVLAQDRRLLSDQNYRVNMMMLLANKNFSLMTELYPQEKRTAFFDVIDKTDWSTYKDAIWKKELSGVSSEGIRIKEVQPLDALFRFFGDDTKDFFTKEWDYAKAKVSSGSSNFIVRKAQEALGTKHTTFVIRLKPYDDAWGYVRVFPVRETKDGAFSSVYANFQTNMKVKGNEEIFLKVLYMIEETMNVNAIYTDKLVTELEKNQKEVYVEYDATGQQYDVKESKYKFDEQTIRDYYLKDGGSLKGLVSWFSTVGNDIYSAANDVIKFPIPDNVPKWKRALMLAYYTSYIEDSKSYPWVINETIRNINAKSAYYWGLTTEDLAAAKVIAKDQLKDRVYDTAFLTKLSAMRLGISDLAKFLKNDPNALMAIYKLGVYKDEKSWDEFFTRLAQITKREIEEEEADNNYDCLKGLYASFLQFPEKYWLDTYVQKLEAAQTSKDLQYKILLVSAMSSLTTLPNKLWAIATDYSDLQAFSDVLENIKAWPLDFWKRQLPQIIKKNVVTWWKPLAAQKDWPDAFRIQVAGLLKDYPQLLLALKNQPQLTEDEWTVVEDLMTDSKVPTVYLTGFLSAQKQLTSTGWDNLLTFIKDRGLTSSQVTSLLEAKPQIPEGFLSKITKDPKIGLASLWAVIPLLKQVKDEDLTPPKTLNVSNTSPSKNLAFKSSSWSNSKNNLSSANLSLYKLYFKYQIMDDVDLKQQLKILLNNASKTDVDIDSKQDLLDAYTTVIQSFVTPLVTLKKATDDYAKYNKKVSALVNDGSAELYTALTEYLYRNYKKDLVTGFDNYDGLEIRNDYGFMIGFLEKYPLGSSESDGVSSLYESVVMKLIDDDINPTTIFDGDIIKELEKKAEEIEEQEDFDALFEITNNSEATSTQAAYSEQRVKEVLLTGKMTVGDVEPLRLYAQDMIDNGKLSNAKIAINALAAFNEDVTALSEELKTKQGIIIPKSYYETSDMPIYQVAVKYLDMTKEDALKMTDAELVYKGLAVIVSNLSSQKALTREDANFLNDAVFPYMLARINVLTGTLGKVSTGKGERTRTENVLLSYVLGVNVLSEVLLAAPGTVTMGLRDYSPDSFKAKRDYAFDKAKEAITDKTKFDACLDDHDDYNKLYDFEDDVKADLFIKGY